MRESSFTILRVRGIPIGAHWSWLFVFALVLWSLATVLVPATYPGLDGATYLAMAAVAAVVFFASVLAHELGHALRAVGEGSGSTGSPCGCSAGWPAARPARVARGRVPDRRRRSGGHGAPGGGLLAAGAGCGRLGWPDAVRGVFDYLARINLLVLGFNLVPALPLDGGRVLRAWLWRRQGSSGGCSTSAPVAGSRLTRPPNEEAGPMTQQVQTERRSPPPPTRRILQGLGSLLLIGAIFYFLLKGIDLGQVWAIRALTWLELATLAAIAGSNLCTYALVWMSVTPGLSFGRAMVMTQATTAPANTVPAPAPHNRIGMTYGMLGSWGYSRSRTTAAVLVSGVWNSFLKLSLLVLALALVGLQGNASGARVTAALLGIGGLVTAVVVFALMLRSQEGAHRFGVLAGRVASRLLRLVGRPSVDGWELSPVSQWMTKDPLTATPDTTTEEAAQLMLTKRVPPPPRLGGPEPHGDGQHPRRLGLRDPPTPNTGVDLQPGTEAWRCWYAAVRPVR